MPPRPPLPFGVGTDVCQISRVRRLITRPATATAPSPLLPWTESRPSPTPNLSPTSSCSQIDLDKLSRFLRRIFTPRERAGFAHRWGREIAEPATPPSSASSASPNSSPNSNPNSSSDSNSNLGCDAGDRTGSATAAAVTRLSAFLAGRWAAKEAAVKAASSASTLSFRFSSLTSENSDTQYRHRLPHRAVRLHQVLLSSQPGPVRCLVLDEEASPDDDDGGGGEKGEDGGDLDTATVSSSLPPLSPHDSILHLRGKAPLDQSRDAAEHCPRSPLGPDSPPSLPEATDDDWAALDGQEATVSISHDGEYAFATCIIPVPAFPTRRGRDSESHNRCKGG